MELAIYNLINNPDILEKVKEKKASLLGVTREQEAAIVESLNKVRISAYYWI
ncbi:competence pheromone ComX [Bacillus massiliigorillae]|uniref:competence pheromone ComX n=1 Tax=Bacillus massiliigorillae TaxID=1243664 RepID=UPI0003A9EF93|nr:competence pheromone ComX [Bacillus massiliigorillae]